MSQSRKGFLSSLRSGPGAAGGVKLTFGLFGAIFGGLFLMLVAGACSEVGLDYALGSEDTFERLVGPLICLVCAVVGAGLAATALSAATAFIAAGYRAALTVHQRTSRGRLAATLAFTGLGTLAVALGLGLWRLTAGYAAGEPRWVMQGTVVAAVGGLVGLLLLPAALALALGRSGRGHPDPSVQHDSQGGDAEWTFTFLAVLGVVSSMGVVEYVSLVRQVDGRGPLPMGDFVQLGGNYAELTLPPNLEGRYAIILVGSSCGHSIVDEQGTEIRVQHLPKKLDSDGDIERRERLVFTAEDTRRYRARLGKPEEACTCADDDSACTSACALQKLEHKQKCPYAVRLAREP